MVYLLSGEMPANSPCSHCSCKIRGSGLEPHSACPRFPGFAGGNSEEKQQKKDTASLSSAARISCSTHAGTRKQPSSQKPRDTGRKKKKKTRAAPALPLLPTSFHPGWHQMFLTSVYPPPTPLERLALWHHWCCTLHALVPRLWGCYLRSLWRRSCAALWHPTSPACRTCMLVPAEPTWAAAAALWLQCIVSKSGWRRSKEIGKRPQIHLLANCNKAAFVVAAIRHSGGSSSVPVAVFLAHFHYLI